VSIYLSHEYCLIMELCVLLFGYIKPLETASLPFNFISTSKSGSATSVFSFQLNNYNVCLYIGYVVHAAGNYADGN